MAENIYKVEYTGEKNRAKCKEVSCKNAFETGELRIIKGTTKDEKTSNAYYHPQCFWIHMSRAVKAKKVESSSDFEGFDNLTEEDKELLEQQIKDKDNVKPPKRQPAKRKKKQKDDDEDEDSEEKKPKKKAPVKRKRATKKKKDSDDESDD
eukprot:TRINITY_DN7259_c0_g1_i1.p1 TRINITY_DN7259_c0_g1~~TRINITY_DN7259_c0_g1_i1.p1  ORF type:complete len:151 (-),score=63.52 TRINITY_DN7259_c0_g1_i1:97-549(-)